MIKQNDKVLAQELVKKEYLTQTAVDQYLNEIQKSDESLRDHLIRHAYVTQKQILDCLSAIYQLPVVNLKSIEIDKSVIVKIPVRLAWYYKFMPIKIEDKKLSLATAAPMDVKAQDEIRLHLGFEPQVLLARESDILDAMNKYYGLAADKIERLAKETGSKQSGATLSQQKAVEDLEKGADEVSVAKLVNQILLEAYKKRATDIHIEPYRNKVRVRYRIDGILIDANVPPAVKQFYPSIISRIKIMANLSIVEKRVPQDGSAVVKTKEQDLDLRISTIPTPYGESMVIRILPTHVRLLSLEKLGLDHDHLKIFRNLLQKPHGIVLVTGPTGSGKTTTLYACLNEINSDQRKIITLEDPIEYEMEGLTQIQVNLKVDMSFAAGLRSVLRHDPDIIMVGEIRDLETAEIAIRTALTGHLVFSTLHTNDAASGVTRLVEMGVEPFLVSSSIEAFVAQRLIRMICPKCKEEDTSASLDIKEAIGRSLNIADPHGIKIYRGRGCDHCNGTGFYGRSAIYEILTIDEDIRSAIINKERSDHLKVLAMKKGMLTLRQSGWKKVLAGVTTPTEVMYVTESDQGDAISGSKTVDASGATQDQNATGQTRIVTPEILNAKDDYNSRVYPRYKGRVGVRYSIVRQDPKQSNRLITDGVEHSSITKDISAGGVRFVSGYTLSMGTILQLKIQLNKDERSIDCLAKVCRIEDDNLSAMFNLAAYYLDISSADRVRISDYVSKGLAEEGK